ncbi:MAG: T9SS type A sorting domain-containing protein [Bacteroidetes bacterium]|nr:T9SS type A sorting domain-containing protein [Bacteroidota bacterium]
MKTKLLLVALFGAGVLNAQYYQRTNGTPVYDELTDGTNVTLNGQGHLMTGYTQALGGIDLLITRTNVNGVIAGANSFNQIYRLTAPGGVVLSTIPCKILQIPNGRLCVIGSYYSNVATTPPGIFTVVLSPAGAVLSARGWQTVTPAVSTNIAALSACNALPATSNIVYISGYTDAVVGSNNGVRPLLMAINGSTNALIWSLQYDFLPSNTPAKVLPNDLIASPYQPALVNEVFVVGSMYDGNGNDAGFTFRVNAANGNPVSAVTTFDTGANDEFNAVCLATGAGGGTNGFVIAGSTNLYGNLDVLVFKSAPTGDTGPWISIIDYSLSGDNVGLDVIQRQNTFGQWNYYLSGTAFNGSQGGSDMCVFFIDDAGVAQREFTYGTANGERNQEISSFSGTAADGITVFGNTPSSADPGNEYYVKAYYNGISGCNEGFAIPNNLPFNGFRTQYQLSRTGTMNFVGLTNQVQAGPVVTQLCFAVAIAGGSNARNAENEVPASATQVYPNPVSVASPMLSLSFNSPVEQQLEIRITDMLGREVLNQKIFVAEGETISQLQLPSGLAEGIYNLQISGNGISETHRFIVE